MIYDSIDLMPAKLLFRIIETGDISLLSTEKKSDEELESIWEKIQEEHSQINPNQEQNKAFNIYKKIEGLASRYQAISLAVHCMKTERDKELFVLLRNYGYKVTWRNLQEDLNRVERESKAIETKIARAKQQLPKQKKNTSGQISFDEAVLGYASFTGAGFVDTNTITVPQYYALINIGNQKMKALENGKAKQNNKG